MRKTAPSLTLPRGGGLPQRLRSLFWGSWKGAAFLLSFLLFACSPPLPNGILGKKKMTDVLVDFHLAQGMAEAQNGNTDIARYKYIQAVFRKHHITEAQFDSSMVYYSGRAEELNHIYKDVVTRVRVQAERMGLEAEAARDQFASLTSEGDTANIWLGKDFACIVPNQVQSVYNFQMKADSTFRLGDSFLWRFKSQFIARSMLNEAIAQLIFYYEEDTVAAVTELIRTSPMNELRYSPSKELEDIPLQSVAGFIYLPEGTSSDKPKPLLISEMKLIRMHKKQIEMEPMPIDTLDIDSLERDSLLFSPVEKGVRLTPQQMRESQPRERKIHVVKENPNPIHPERGIPQRQNRNNRNNRNNRTRR